MLRSSSAQFDFVSPGCLLNYSLSSVVLEKATTGPRPFEPTGESMLSYHQAIDQTSREEWISEPNHQIGGFRPFCQCFRSLRRQQLRRQPALRVSVRDEVTEFELPH